MDTCIVLRTALVKDGVMHVQAGAGVVYDFVPENEQQECVNKAKALVRAAEEAVRFAGRGGKRKPAKGNGDEGPERDSRRRPLAYVKTYRFSFALAGRGSVLRQQARVCREGKRD